MQTADPSEATILRIKECVTRIRDQENKDEENTKIWQSCVNLLSYMYDLSPKSLRNVRLHTELFTAEHLNNVLLNVPINNPRKYAKKSGYTFATEDLPGEYWLSEPPVEGWLLGDDKLGCDYNGRIINAEIARYQLYFENFVSTFMLDNIRRNPGKSVVMEIGAGYGAVGHHLLKMAPGKICYVVADLPLVLLYSGAYLATHHPEARVFMYDPDEPSHRSMDEKTLLEYDVVLIPNHRLATLSALKQVHYAVNTFSMAEMTTTQVQEYVDFLLPRLVHYFYFHNYEWHEAEPVHRFVGKHFMCRPGLDFYDDYIRKSSAWIRGTYPKTFWFTASKEAHQALAACTVKLRMPDRLPVRLSLKDDRVMVRTRLGRSRALSPLSISIGAAFAKLPLLHKKVKESLRRELVRGF